MYHPSVVGHIVIVRVYSEFRGLATTHTMKKKITLMPMSVFRQHAAAVAIEVN